MPRSFLVLFALAGCFAAPDSSDSAADTGSDVPDGDPATIALNGMCSLATRWGEFEVEVNKSYAVADGVVANGVVPATILEEKLAEGDCRLMKRNNPYCNPTCAAGETCDFDGSCLPYPENQDVGTVTISGLESRVSMEPLVPGNKYSYNDLENPGFDPGDLIELNTEGGAYAPFTLHGVGVVPLVPSSTEWLVTSGQPLTLGWDAPTEAVRSEVFVSVNVDQHGLTPVTLECTFEDDGAAEIPSSVMDALLGSGVSGFPSARIQRRTADKVQLGAGCADFVVDYELPANVSVSGHTPCKNPGSGDCPDGQECNMATETCE